MPQHRPDCGQYVRPERRDHRHHRARLDQRIPGRPGAHAPLNRDVIDGLAAGVAAIGCDFHPLACCRYVADYDEDLSGLSLASLLPAVLAFVEGIPEFPGLELGHFGLPSVNLPLLVELLALEVELVGLELEQLGLLAECLHRVLGGEVRAHSRPAVARVPIHVAQMSDTDVPPAVCTTWITGLAWLALGLGRLGLGEAPIQASMVSGMAEA
jgi:hypothetical protein